MSFGLKNILSKFQNIMNERFNPFSHFSIVYINDVLIFFKSIDEHWKHLNTFLETIKHNGLVISSPKIELFQTKVRFLGNHIYQETFIPINISYKGFLGPLITLHNSIKTLEKSVNHYSKG